MLSDDANAMPATALPVAMLRPGMVLARDLTAGVGVLLLSKDHVLDEPMIRRLAGFEARIGKLLDVLVYRSDT